MDCTDLMLDDWVLDTYTGNPMRVQVISIKVGKGLEPIPITPEILEKNGFEKRDVRVMLGTKVHYVLSDDYFDFSLNEYTDSIWEVEYFNTEAHFPPCRVFVCYLHELQHALRLCGIDKEIVI